MGKQSGGAVGFRRPPGRAASGASVCGRRGPGHRSPLQVCAGVPWQVPPVPPGVAAPGLLGLVCEHVSCFATHGFLDSGHLVKEPYFSLLIQARAFM